MKTMQLSLLVAGFLTMHLLAQTPQKLAEINKKVVGKWVSSDKKSYIEFLANGSCSVGGLWPDGKWKIDQGTLGAWQQGDDFSCGSGALTLIGPNTLTRDFGMGGDPEKFYRGAGNLPKPVGPLTVIVAQRILNQQLDQTTVNNTLLTCHACYDADDKGENDKAPIVSTYSAPLSQFLMVEGYIRVDSGRAVFTGKAKSSKYYGYNDGAPGLRFANFRNPRVLTSAIKDPRHVPVEYDLVPTELTARVFGKVQQIRATVRFSHKDGAWEVCLACR